MKTQATQFLDAHKVAYTEHTYEYVEHGGTEVSAKSLGVDEHHVVKTLVMEDERAQGQVVLQIGERLRQRRVQPGAERVALFRHVESDDRDIVAAFDENGFAHAAFQVSSPSSPRPVWPGDPIGETSVAVSCASVRASSPATS